MHADPHREANTPARPPPLTDSELEALAVAELDALRAPDPAVWAEVETTAQELLARQAEEAEPRSAPGPFRGTDGLTRAQRRLLYDPARYAVEEFAAGVWIATHRDVPALFVVRALDRDGSWLQVVSNTGHRYEVRREIGDPPGACACPDHEKAQAEARPCKHLAVALAVWELAGARRDDEPPEQP